MSYPKFKEWKEEDKQKLINNFKLIEREFDSLGYKIILHAGTLLGATRDNTMLMDEDNDIDFIILHTSKDIKVIREKIKEIDSHFYNRNMLCKDLHFLGNNHYFINEQHFDGWHGWFDENNKFYLCWDIYGELCYDDIFPLKSFEYKNNSFYIPNKSEVILKLIYGKDWETPSQTKHKINELSIYKFLDGHQYIFPNRKITQKELLLSMRHLLSKHDIGYFLMTGTLLGAVREKDFIAHDPNDIDLGLDIKDYWKVKGLLDKSDFKYKFQWNKELAVYKGDNVHPHIDLFFYTYDKKTGYCYSYKPNRFTHHWDEEWRMEIPANLLFPIKKDFMFLDVPFNVPAKPEQYLEYLYGENWKIPDQKWSYTNFRNHDREYQSVTAVVTTFNRPECLNRLVESFQATYPEIKLIIGSQNRERISYDYKNVEVIQLPEDCGLSYARNELVKNVKTEFTLLLEDDFVMLKNTNIYKMMEVFGYDEKIGIVGGRLLTDGKIHSYEKFLFVLDKTLISIDWRKCLNTTVIKKHKINYTEFGICDIIYNFFLAKTKVLLENPWDNAHKIHSEHMDFFLNLKINTDIKIAFIPDVIIQHAHPDESNEYKVYRERMYYNFIYTKYGIEKGYTLGETAMINYKENKKQNI